MPYKPLVLPREIVDYMKAMSLCGLTCPEIGRYLGVAKAIVYRNFRDNGMKPWRGRPRNMRGREWPQTRQATRRPTMRDIGWAAGFMEGEASFSGGSIHVSQVNSEPLERLLKLFGGNIHPVKSRAANQKPSYCWRASGARGRGISLTLWPLLSAKRRREIERNSLWRAPLGS